jgi:hypothetical protein
MAFKVPVETKCPVCKKTEHIYVNQTDFVAWQEGKFAQDAFPYLTPAQREQLISGTCAPCWDKLFPPEEDEEG